MTKRMSAIERARAGREFVQKARLRINKKQPKRSNATTALYIRIPASLKVALEDVSRDERKPVNAVCVELLEKGLLEQGL